jgi:hypothetical protein
MEAAGTAAAAAAAASERRVAARQETVSLVSAAKPRKIFGLSF